MNKSSLKIPIILAAVAAICLLKAPQAAAQAVCPLDTIRPKQVESLDIFRQIPVLNEGRIKPMESYARNILLQFSGRGRYQDESATEWFSRFLFAPRSTYNDKIFLINHPEIAEALKIEPSKKRRYSYSQLEPGYDKLHELAIVADKLENENKTIVDNEILRVFTNLRLYMRLSGAFAFAVPHPDFKITNEEVIRSLELPADQPQYSFYDIVLHAGNLSAIMANIRGVPEDQLTSTQQEYLRIFNAVFFWMDHYANCPIGLIPTKNVQNEHWVSPMDILISSFDDPQYRQEITHLRNMTKHYWYGDQLEFDLAARAYIDSLDKRLTAKEQKALNKFPTELAYNRMNLFLWCKLVYGLTLLLFLVSLFFDQKYFRKTAFIMLIFALAMHTTAIIMRMIILSRPPVSNLYETFIFVGGIGVLLGLILELINKNWLGNIVASVCGLVFLLIGAKFASEGDTMQMLIAVLNSNFWLGTHVISITIGYAGCCVAGVMGHVYVLQALMKPKDKKLLETTYKNMMGVLGFGLTMTLLGTALGGIWADQSWGRFWGWDPKENGALMIVIWSAIIFHAKIARIIHPLGAAVGCILGLIVVMWAWFGVNLLSIGLHSYGFTSGIANTLLIYVLLELAFISVFVFILGKKGIKF